MRLIEGIVGKLEKDEAWIYSPNRTDTAVLWPNARKILQLDQRVRVVIEQTADGDGDYLVAGQNLSTSEKCIGLEAALANSNVIQLGLRQLLNFGPVGAILCFVPVLNWVMGAGVAAYEIGQCLGKKSNWVDWRIGAWTFLAFFVGGVALGMNSPKGSFFEGVGAILALYAPSIATVVYLGKCQKRVVEKMHNLVAEARVLMQQAVA